MFPKGGEAHGFGVRNVDKMAIGIHLNMIRLRFLIIFYYLIYSSKRIESKTDNRKVVNRKVVKVPSLSSFACLLGDEDAIARHSVLLSKTQHDAPKQLIP